MTGVTKKWLNYLSDQDIKNIDQASRRVLAKAGIKVEDKALIARLKEKGCTSKNGKVQIPGDLIDTALKALPRSLTLIGRNQELLEVGTGNTVTHTGGSIPYIKDLETGQKRNASLTDLEDMVRLMNHLENLSMVGPVIQPWELPAGISEILQMATVLKFGQKPLAGQAVSTAAQARYICEIYQVIAASIDNPDQHPMAMIGISPESPLYYPAQITGVMEALISKGIPTVALVAPILGFTAPLTIAGGLVQMNASILACCVLSHGINRDVPVIYGARLCAANMANGHSMWGVPEIGMFGACSVQLSNYYGLPNDVYGYISTSCAHDMQLGAETALNGLLPFLAGADSISGFGSFGSAFISSFEDLVFDNEVFAMHRRISQGVKIDTDHLAVDVITDAMNAKEYYLSPHTLKHLRTGELFRPQVGLYALPQQWEKEGSKTMEDRCRERVKKILHKNQYPALPGEIEKEFKIIIDAAKKELC